MLQPVCVLQKFWMGGKRVLRRTMFSHIIYRSKKKLSDLLQPLYKHFTTSAAMTKYSVVTLVLFGFDQIYIIMHDLPRSFLSGTLFTSLMFLKALLMHHNPSNSLALMEDCVTVKTDQNLDIVNMLKDAFQRCLLGQPNYIAQDNYVYFFISSQKTCCGYLLEVPRRGASNEYPQHVFSWRNKKNINNLLV